MSNEPPAEIQVFSFTSTIVGRSLRLVNSATIKRGDASITVDAQWDTGASNTCIAMDVARALNLPVTGMAMMQTPSGMREMPTYMIDLLLPNGVTITDLAVIGSEIGSQGIGVLVGMDVITFGDFSVSCKDGLTRFSFRIPSLEHADFVGLQGTTASDTFKEDK